jgi:NADH:ubiquinone reductase (H+-translocating)
MQKKTIVIAGGGYGGLSVIHSLQKEMGADFGSNRVVIVDRRDYHMYSPSLYEMATSEEEFVGASEYKKSMALPYKEILSDKVEFILGEITEVEQYKKTITVDGKVINYDYLVLAMGSCVDYFGIEGLKENSIPLKGVKDALRIRNRLEFAVQQHRLDTNKHLLRIVIGGGGYVGVEFAAELLNLADILSWKYSYPREKIEIVIIEGANQLIPGMGESLGRRMFRRLTKMGVKIQLSTMITKVSSTQITMNNGEVINYDALIWAGGVRANDVPFVHKMEKDRKNRCVTNKYLMVDDKELGIFVIGDVACILDRKGTPLPQTAFYAIEQGDYVGYSIAELMRGGKPVQYIPKGASFIVPVRGKWAMLMLSNGLTITGYIPWLLRRVVDLRYFLRFMPFTKAYKTVWKQTELNIKND